MSRVNVICENNHFDPLMYMFSSFSASKGEHNVLLSEFPTYNELLNLRDGCQALETQGLLGDWFSEQYMLYNSRKCISSDDNYSLKAYFILKGLCNARDNGKLIATFDDLYKEEILDSMNMCNVTSFQSQKFFDIGEKRDDSIVNVVTSLLRENVGSNRVLVEMGKGHCVDLYIKLRSGHDELQEEIRFLYITSDQYVEEETRTLDFKYYSLNSCEDKFSENYIELYGNEIEKVLGYEYDRGYLEQVFLNNSNVVNVPLSVVEEGLTPHEALELLDW